MNTVEISEPSEGVKVVTLSRPEAANALNTAMGEELLALWTELARDVSVRAAVLTGAGRFFCAGADLKERDGMSDQQALMLIFEPGFSTADKITDVSGRGVGMDVVRTNIERIGGVVDVESEVGVGTTFHARLPLTKAMVASSLISALIIKVGHHSFCIPQSAVNELITILPREFPSMP